ncbi:hypothetical protein LSAT2_006024 [Lamellibrachia satsuma]|nr:hypothetical protein LSAT2_006024 [Lamellibrachia satsuma]
MPQPSRRTVRVGESSRGRLAVFFYSEDKADVGHSKHYPVLRTTVVLQGSESPLVAVAYLSFPDVSLLVKVFINPM